MKVNRIETTTKKNELKQVSNHRLLLEIENRLADQLIVRRDLLKLAGIRYCLECKKDSAEKLTIEGFCKACETN